MYTGTSEMQCGTARILGVCAAKLVVKRRSKFLGDSNSVSPRGTFFIAVFLYV